MLNPGLPRAASDPRARRHRARSPHLYFLNHATNLWLHDTATLHSNCTHPPTRRPAHLRSHSVQSDWYDMAVDDSGAIGKVLAPVSNPDPCKM